MKLNMFKYSILLILPLLFVGCFEDHASQFHLDDANQVEWAPPNRNSSSLSATVNLEADQTESETLILEVQLIGAQTNSARSVFVTVNEEETDATEDTHFSILNSGNEVVIPANSNHGEVEITILAENISNGESFSAVLELQEGDELGVAKNMKDMSLTIEKAEE